MLKWIERHYKFKNFVIIWKLKIPISKVKFFEVELNSVIEKLTLEIKNMGKDMASTNW